MNRATVTGIALLALLMHVAPSIAYDERGYSTNPKLILSRPSGGEIAFDSAQKMNALIDHCKAGNAMFTQATPGGFKCTARTGETWRSAGAIDIKGTPTDYEQDDVWVFSTTPLKNTRWIERPVSALQKKALVASLPKESGPATKRGMALDFISAKAISRAGGVRTMFMVPAEKVEDEEAGYEAQVHIVFVEAGGIYRYMGEIPESPSTYFDADGDDIPEFTTEESCDGLCVTLWVVMPKLERSADFTGH